MTKNKKVILISVITILIIIISIFAVIVSSKNKNNIISLYDWIFEKYDAPDEDSYYSYITNYATSYLEAVGALRISINTPDEDPTKETRNLTLTEAHDIAELSHKLKKTKIQKLNVSSLDFNGEEIFLYGERVILFPYSFFDQDKKEYYTFDGYKEFYLKIKNIIKIDT